MGWGEDKEFGYRITSTTRSILFPQLQTPRTVEFGGEARGRA